MTTDPFELIRDGDLAAFRAAVTDAAATRGRDRQNRTVLTACVEEGRLEMAAHALSVGAEVNARPSHPLLQNRTALERAIERPRPRMVRLLLDNGAVLRPSDAPTEWLGKGAPPCVVRALWSDGPRVDDPRVEILDLLVERLGITRAASGSHAAATPETSATPGSSGEPRPNADGVFDAIERGDAAALEVALAAGADANSGDVTPLHAAVEKGDAALVRILLAHRANPNQWTEDWSYPAGPPHASPISLAAERGDVEILRLLLDAVKKPTQAKEKMPGVDPLAISENPEVAELLLARGAKVGDEAVAAFLRARWFDTARAALDKVSKKLGKPLDGERSSLDEALAARAPLDIIERLLSLGAKPTTKFPAGLDADLASLLASRGISSPEPATIWEVASLETNEEIVSFVAARGGHEIAAAVLAEAGRHDAVAAVAEAAPPPQYDQEARKILDLVDDDLALRLIDRWKIPLATVRGARFVTHAVEKGRAGLVRALLARGAAVIDPPAPDSTIFCAARTGKPDVLAACLETLRPVFRLAPIWLLSCQREKTPPDAREEMLGRLLAASDAPARDELADLVLAAGHAGASTVLSRCLDKDPTLLAPKQNEYGIVHSALHGAVVNGHLETARLCLERGADPNTSGPEGAPVLFTAIEKGHLDLMRLLVSFGADVTRAGPNGELPLARASTDESWTLARSLGCVALYREG